jgi:hypothetical protein
MIVKNDPGDKAMTSFMILYFGTAIRSCFLQILPAMRACSLFGRRAFSELAF